MSRGNINKDFAERTGDLRAGAALRRSAAGKEKVETGSLQPPSHRVKNRCPSVPRHWQELVGLDLVGGCKGGGSRRSAGPAQSSQSEDELFQIFMKPET